MSEDYETICKELDALTISYLSSLKDYTENWENASKCFQQGFVDLAHAKYTMGTRSISHYSYDTRMKAKLEVEIDDFKNYSVKKASITKAESKEEGLRKRNRIKEKDSEENEDRRETVVEKNKDSLHWFGLFVSPSLRNSQKSFKSVTNTLIDQVNTMRELKEMEEKYRNLLERKVQKRLKDEE